MTAKEQSKSGPDTEVSGIRDRKGVSSKYPSSISQQLLDE